MANNKVIAKKTTIGAANNDSTVDGETQPPAKVKPVIVKAVTTAPAHNTEVHADVEIPVGHAYVVPLIDGREDHSEAFFYPLRNVDKIYGNPDRFIIKKKVN